MFFVFFQRLLVFLAVHSRLNSDRSGGYMKQAMTSYVLQQATMPTLYLFLRIELKFKCPVRYVTIDDWSIV